MPESQTEIENIKDQTSARGPAHPGLIRIIVVLQSVLLFGHFLVYQTWKFSPAGEEPRGSNWIRLILSILSVSFVPASFLAFRSTHLAVRVFYRITAIWTGLLSFLFFASIASWVIWGVARLTRYPLSFHSLVEWLFSAALMAGLYAVLNAHWTRITRQTVQLQNLPPAWLGRKIVLISDLHLGPLRNG
jgi:uncharacterized protein